ncbi:PEP-CTERM/exosortase system-associated acyltransferase [Marinobacter orientalis]|uniref:PEP-CTERM/exosortase system-associated acyltransferase n=1 Tax=Marinobacter orientalis TaxID=1928859 RepID=A0A7Y0RCR1_9GAMM|nr:PEP-CTERM/exosortase system-associated acyltransferase [Marinobacter orientalis]NMT63813.1 PEP-CTERM/exosortase system-associated acyltransferase [Marinobacter orientalis]TGX49918.1 PEP-CTERM/exosortase system-associated acyltransferase [Marinobacter orientalis]
MNTGFARPDHTENIKNQQIEEDVSTIFNSAFSVQLATSPEVINEVFEVRYQVYCIDRPFEDPDCFADKREHDAYDSRSAHALIRHRMTGESVAAVRLVMAGDTPVQADFPMEAPCLHLMDRYAQEAFAAARREQVAEISRMAVSREFRRRLNEDKTTSGISDFAGYSDSENGKRALPYISLGIFAAILQMSVKHGITHWMAVMEPALLRVLKRFGVEFDHVGPVTEYHGRRRPAFTEAASLIEGIRKRRPDVWSLITDDGRYLPAKPATAYKAIEKEVA